MSNEANNLLALLATVPSIVATTWEIEDAGYELRNAGLAVQFAVYGTDEIGNETMTPGFKLA